MDANLLFQIKQLVSGLDVAVAVVNPQDFAYEGFDPVDVIRVLYAKATAQSVNDHDFIIDMSTIVTIGLMRGTLSSKSIQRTSRAGQQRITSLKARYGLAEKVTRENARAITVPRVVNSFPHLASRINSAHSLGRGFSGPMNSQDLPPAMMHVAFGSLIPKGLETVTPLMSDAYMAFAIDMNVVVNRKHTDQQSIVAMYNQQTTYFQAAINSPLYSSTERVSILVELGLTSQESYRSLVKTANTVLGHLGYESGFTEDYNGFLLEMGLTIAGTSRFRPSQSGGMQPAQPTHSTGAFDSTGNHSNLGVPMQTPLQPSVHSINTLPPASSTQQQFVSSQQQMDQPTQGQGPPSPEQQIFNALGVLHAPGEYFEQSGNDQTVPSEQVQDLYSSPIGARSYSAAAAAFPRGLARAGFRGARGGSLGRASGAHNASQRQ